MRRLQTVYKSIYIIEDDPASASMLREVLELEGDSSWNITVLSTGSDAMRAIDAHAPDLVLLDISLPDIDGAAVFKYMRKKSSTRNKPVLFISGATNYDLHTHGIDEGVLLRKPVSVNSLLHVVRAHLAAA